MAFLATFLNKFKWASWSEFRCCMALGPISPETTSTNIKRSIWSSATTKGTKPYLFGPKNQYLIQFWPFTVLCGYLECQKGDQDYNTYKGIGWHMRTTKLIIWLHRPFDAILSGWLPQFKLDHRRRWPTSLWKKIKTSLIWLVGRLNIKQDEIKFM